MYGSERLVYLADGLLEPVQALGRNVVSVSSARPDCARTPSGLQV